MVELFSVAGIIALAVVGVALFMAATGRDVPDWLTMAVGSVVGYFYSKVENLIRKNEKNDKPNGTE